MSQGQEYSLIFNLQIPFLFFLFLSKKKKRQTKNQRQQNTKEVKPKQNKKTTNAVVEINGQFD